MDDLLQQQDEDLWPAVPATVPAMESWLARAWELIAKLDGHGAALADLRARAKPWTDEQRAKDRAFHTEELERLAELEAQIADFEAELQRAASVTRLQSQKEKIEAALKETRETLATERARLEPRLSERLTYEFNDPTLVWRHEKLAELVKRLRAFKENGSTEVGVTSVERRLAFAQTLERRTILDQQ